MVTALADALATPTPAPQRCKVGRWINTLTDAETTALADALAVEAPNTIHTRLARTGHAPASPAVWWRHWAEVCACQR